MSLSYKSQTRQMIGPRFCSREVRKKETYQNTSLHVFS